MKCEKIDLLNLMKYINTSEERLGLDKYIKGMLNIYTNLLFNYLFIYNVNVIYMIKSLCCYYNINLLIIMINNNYYDFHNSYIDNSMIILKL